MVFFFTHIAGQHHSEVCSMQGKQKGKKQKKRASYHRMNSNLMPNPAFSIHVTDFCWFHGHTKIPAYLLVRIEEY